ncbi:uncharacterized protein ACA1_291060 [Acanthamoeba castellanii str. Neff]|uniref:Uncharacterized protein n=1 Tax=Acanthamoeba castellanii (strain ATCC 30010 / Neff) TaxID=1257118 RepID=L8HKX4_ACACF|nr:uncharacterized protein ACA1_291060 [Acanthamoeba castellanii str. Neff]ELR25328.1 hypothetical protein ACA1_291060 [Acanthamoeba castellanii str. Neff]
MKLDVLFWALIGFSQLATWNIHFENWEHGWGNHNAFWARRLPVGVPAAALTHLGTLAFVVAVLQLTRKRLLMALGLLLGLPFVWWVLYHCWVPYLFDCNSLWHHGGSYRHFDFKSMAWKSGVDYAKPKVMLRAWAKEYRDSIRVVPLLHDSPFFVDLGSMLLTALLVLAYYYSLKAFVWPRDGCDEVVDQPATDKNAGKKKQEEEKKQQKEKVDEKKKKQQEEVPTKSGSSSRKQGETKKGAAGATPSKSSKKNN